MTALPGSGSAFAVTVTALPQLAGAVSPAAAAEPWSRLPPRVVIFPFLCEQSSRGETATRPVPGLGDVPAAFEALFPAARLAPALRPVRGNERAYQASDLAAFLQASWPLLAATNVLVTHRNFLKNEVLGRAFAGAAGRIPNAAVLRLEVRRGEEQKTIFFVRHCTSHHNASLRGDGFMTTCASLDAVRTAAAALRRVCGAAGDVLFGCSILPRAILSCLALQAPMPAAALERARRAFQPEDEANPEEVLTYQRRQACEKGGGGGAAQGAFCGGGSSTFILAPRGRAT